MGGLGRGLDLDAEELVVGVDGLVSHLDGELHCERRLLDVCDHLAHVLGLARGQRLRLRGGRVLQVVQVGDLLGQEVPEPPSGCRGARPGGVDGADLELRSGPERIDRLDGLKAWDLHQRRMSKVFENICLAAFIAVTFAS